LRKFSEMCNEGNEHTVFKGQPLEHTLKGSRKSPLLRPPLTSRSSFIYASLFVPNRMVFLEPLLSYSREHGHMLVQVIINLYLLR